MDIHVGCSGWFYWHWKGLFYPATEPTHRWFKHYTSVFTTVELNAPFYKWPQPATVRGWLRNSPDNFRYTVKVNRQITHEKRMVGTQRLINKFYEIAEVLGPKLGCFLFQFPPSYHYSPARLKSIVKQLNPAHRNAIEFRHKSWWRPVVFRALAKHKLIFCAVSGPRLPDDLPPKVDRLYIRFHGSSRWYRHDYSLEELTAWATRIAATGASEAWIYFNNDREGFAIKNALELRGLLQERL